MINIIGANSLKRASQNLESDDRNALHYITAITFPSLNPYARIDLPKLSFLLDLGSFENPK